MKISPINYHSSKTNNIPQKSNNPNFGKLIVNIKSFEDPYYKKFLVGILENKELKEFVKYFNQFKLDVELAICDPALDGYLFTISTPSKSTPGIRDFQMQYRYKFRDKAVDIINNLNSDSVKLPKYVHSKDIHGNETVYYVHYCNVTGAEFLKNFNSDEAIKCMEEEYPDTMKRLCGQLPQNTKGFFRKLRWFNSSL